MTRQVPALERADKWISRAAGATVAGLAGIAGAISYSHMRQLAAAHGDAGWHAHAFPLSVDGVEIVASLVLLADRRVGRRSGWLPWTALTIGTLASLAANIATADTGIISRVIAGWPAAALLIAVKLLSGILEHRPTWTAPAVASPGTGNVDGTGNGNGAARTRLAGSRPGRPAPAAVSPTQMMAADTVPGTTGLITAARAARDALHQDGQPLTRDALAPGSAPLATRSATLGSLRSCKPSAPKPSSATSAPRPLRSGANAGRGVTPQTRPDHRQRTSPAGSPRQSVPAISHGTGTYCAYGSNDPNAGDTSTGGAAPDPASSCCGRIGSDSKNAPVSGTFSARAG